MSVYFHVNSCYLDKAAVQSVLDIEGNNFLQAQLSALPDNLGSAKGLYLDDIYTRAAMSLIQRLKIPALHSLLLENKSLEGSLFTLDDNFLFPQGSNSRRERLFHTAFRDFAGISLKGSIAQEHFSCLIAFAKLSGQRKQFLFGRVEEFDGRIIYAKPILMGDKVLVDAEAEVFFPFQSFVKY